MKKIQLLCSLLMLTTAIHAQERRPYLDSIPDNKLKRISVAVVNQLMLAIKKMEECPCAILDGTLDLFSPNAIIEVSNIRGALRKYTPLSYFRTINALRCGKDRVYRSMKFDYRPVSESDAIISRFNGTCTVSYQVTQTFVGWAVRGNNAYSDRTRKVIIIHFIWDGIELEPKIVGITVTTTENCHVNEPPANHS